MTGGLSIAPERGLPVVVSGMVASVPEHGGATWAVLQYLHGLRDLGYDPVLVESVGAAERSPRVASYFSRLCESQGLEGRATLVDELGGTFGMKRSDLLDLVGRAPLLLDLAGTLRDEDVLGRVGTRVYVDLDPGFTQLWQTTDGIDMRLGGHTHFATVGLDIGRPACRVPTLGLEWIPTLPPVCLDRWRRTEPGAGRAWTTIANWRGYGSITHDGRRYGQKAHSFRPLFTLPRRTGVAFEVALSIHPDERDDLASLEAEGWTLIDPSEVASTPARYRRFIAGSRAEIGIAKEGYVEADCGWFSDRSACYLAAGRPVLALDTGFSRHLPTGLGLLSFGCIDEAVAGVEAIERDYDRHARAAREIAESHFDARRVLSGLLDRVGIS